MNIKKIVFVTMDEDYVSSIEYKLVEIIGKSIEIEFITTREYFNHFMSIPKKVDILVMPLSMKSEMSDKLNIGKIFYLTEEKMDEDININADTIYKYGSVRYLVEKLDSSLFAKNERNDKEGTKTIGIYSATGGCGKTLVALAVAHNLYKKGNRVLYVNTQCMQDFAFYIKCTESLSEEFVYQCSVNIKNALKILSDEIKNIGFDYIPPFKKLPITYQIEFDAYVEFINSIKIKNTYDYIVVELSEELSAKKVSFMHECDRNLLVTTQGEVAVRKLETFLNNMASFNDKVTILCNRCWGNKTNFLEISALAKPYEISEYIDEYASDLTFDDVKQYDLFSRTTLCLE